MLNTITLLPFFSGLTAIALGAIVALRDPGARANRLLAAGLGIAGLHQMVLGAATMVSSGSAHDAVSRAAFGLAALFPPLWFQFGLTFGKANQRIHLSRWLPAVLVLWVTAPLVWLGLWTGRVLLPGNSAAAGQGAMAVDAWGKAAVAVLLTGLTLVLLRLENLYRSADRLTRWRIKFLVVGTFVAFSAQILLASYTLLYGTTHPWQTPLSVLAFFGGQSLIAFALVRHRLLHIDVFVSRYVVLRSLTLAVVGGYLLCVATLPEVSERLQLPLDRMTGLLLGSLGAAGLALVLLSDTVRRSVQRYVHTHFYKHKYDFHAEWMALTRRLSHATTIPAIAAETVRRLLEVMWVRQVALYTVNGTAGQLALTYQVEYDRLPATVTLSPAAITELQDAARSEFRSSKSLDVSAIPSCLLASLDGVPIGMVVPMVALDTLAGLLIVGPEVSGEPFGLDDRDLLAAVAAQAGAMIVNARLAQESSDGRELQLFARLSAFVTHDLKNSTTMLGMLAENASQHMHKPAFQADVVKILNEVTGRMRRLLSTLTTPQTRLGAPTIRTSLNTVVEQWLSDLKNHVPPHIALSLRLDPTPEVEIDPDQLRSVLANLVLNAVEATPGNGPIHIATEGDHGLAVLTVTDSGCGMPPAFLRDRAFRPFQTTKPRGLGIGLYQCRHIVQSHGGALMAESQEGVGTRMTIRLPAVSKEHFANTGVGQPG